MAKIAMAFGVLLVLLGGYFFVSTGSSHPTALIASGFGLLLLVCGLLARTEDAKRRMLWMHIAVTVGLLGFLFPGARVAMTLMRGKPATGAAMLEQEIMAGLCLVFTLLCVRSFVAARRERLA